MGLEMQEMHLYAVTSQIVFFRWMSGSLGEHSRNIKTSPNLWNIHPSQIKPRHRLLDSLLSPIANGQCFLGNLHQNYHKQKSSWTPARRWPRDHSPMFLCVRWKEAHCWRNAHARVRIFIKNLCCDAANIASSYLSSSRSLGSSNGWWKNSIRARVCARAQLKMKRNGCCLLNAYTQANDDRSRSVCRWRSVGAVEYVWPRRMARCWRCWWWATKVLRDQRLMRYFFVSFFTSKQVTHQPAANVSIRGAALPMIEMMILEET